MNLPTMLTLGRVAVVPMILVVLCLPGWLVERDVAEALATALFVMAALTDWLDGYLARRWKQTTQLGAFLDPVADKLLVCTCLVALVAMGRLAIVAAAVIICREIAVSALREWMAQRGRANVVAVAMTGKVKTAAQLIGIPFMMCELQIAGVGSVSVGGVLLWVAAGLALVSMWEYCAAAMKSMQAKHEPVLKQQV